MLLLVFGRMVLKYSPDLKLVKPLLTFAAIRLFFVFPLYPLKQLSHPAWDNDHGNEENWTACLSSVRTVFVSGFRPSRRACPAYQFFEFGPYFPLKRFRQLRAILKCFWLGYGKAFLSSIISIQDKRLQAQWNDSVECLTNKKITELSILIKFHQVSTCEYSVCWQLKEGLNVQ